MTVTDLAIIAGLVFALGTLSARLKRFDMTAPIVFPAAVPFPYESRDFGRAGGGLQPGAGARHSRFG